MSHHQNAEKSYHEGMYSLPEYCAGQQLGTVLNFVIFSFPYLKPQMSHHKKLQF
jgi:hypothetical protein